VVGRRLRAEQQPAQEIRPRGNSHKRSGPANVPAYRAMEASILDHRTEPVFNLGRQAAYRLRLPP